MNPLDDYVTYETRRQFFGKSARGLGAAALASLTGEEVARAASGDGAGYHFAPKAKRAIYLFMSGAPSQIDLFDHKPKMAEWYDKDLPDSIRQGQRLTTMTSGQKRFPIAPSIYEFQKHGECGMEISEVLPNMAKMTDDIALVRSMYTEAINHDPAITYIQTGSQIPGRPSLGAWLSYGLGSMNENLPAFVVLQLDQERPKLRMLRALYAAAYGAAGFMPSNHQGVSSCAQRRRSRALPFRRSHGRDGRRQSAGRWLDWTPMARSIERPARGRLDDPEDRTPASQPTRWPTACRARCRN